MDKNAKEIQKEIKEYTYGVCIPSLEDIEKYLTVKDFLPKDFNFRTHCIINSIKQGKWKPSLDKSGLLNLTTQNKEILNVALELMKKDFTVYKYFAMDNSIPTTICFAAMAAHKDKYGDVECMIPYLYRDFGYKINDLLSIINSIVNLPTGTNKINNIIESLPSDTKTAIYEWDISNSKKNHQNILFPQIYQHLHHSPCDLIDEISYDTSEEILTNIVNNKNLSIEVKNKAFEIGINESDIKNFPEEIQKKICNRRIDNFFEFINKDNNIAFDIYKQINKDFSDGVVPKSSVEHLLNRIQTESLTQDTKQGFYNAILATIDDAGIATIIFEQVPKSFYNIHDMYFNQGINKAQKTKIVKDVIKTYPPQTNKILCDALQTIYLRKDEYAEILQNTVDDRLRLSFCTSPIISPDILKDFSHSRYTSTREKILVEYNLLMRKYCPNIGKNLFKIFDEMYPSMEIFGPDPLPNYKDTPETIKLEIINQFPMIFSDKVYIPNIENLVKESNEMIEKYKVTVGENEYYGQVISDIKNLNEALSLYAQICYEFGHNQLFDLNKKEDPCLPQIEPQDVIKYGSILSETEINKLTRDGKDYIKDSIKEEFRIVGTTYEILLSDKIPEAMNGYINLLYAIEKDREKELAEQQIEEAR